MKETVESSAQEAQKLPIAVILGLEEQADGEWAHLRSMQIAALEKFTNLRIASQLLAGLTIVALYLPTIAVHWLFIWFVALCIANIRGFFQTRELTAAEVGRGKAPALTKSLHAPILNGIVWGGALIGFGTSGSEAAHMTVWALLMLLILGSMMFFALSPLATLVFGAIIGVAAAISFAMVGNYTLMAISVLYIGMAYRVVVDSARTNLAARLVEHGVQEKDEVVSLLLREFEENEADWLWQIDTARRVRSISPRFAYALGCDQSEAEGKPLLELIAGESWETGKFATSLHDLAELLKHRESFSNQIVQVSVRGENKWWELSGTPMRDERDNFLGFRGVGSDVTEQRESSEKIAYLARYDTLTALPNRMQIHEALGEALRYADQWRTRCAFLMIDLDRFKAVNDSLGHLVGDKLLAQVSSRLQEIVGQEHLCGRLGGDEFAIVIRDATDRDVVERVARQIIDDLTQPYRVDQHTLYVGASVGSAIGPRDGNTVEEIMRNADLALYRSKDEGGGEHFRFEPYLHQSADERRQLESSLREAMERDELLLNFQPVVGAHDEQVVSFEALLRWNSKEHGFVSPGKFVPLAEETRLIVPIGQWVLRQSCMEARNWPEHIKVNVNVSPEQLLEPGFSDEVVSALSDSGLRPERLEVEVTESIFLRDASVAREALEQVMALGCSVALDDFGTGYSSLGYLRKLRFSTIKVDRTFVQGAAQGSAESIAIIRAVVAMAQSLDLTTTAEGVENADEAELLRSLGCDKIQGFYFGRPMSAPDARKIFLPKDDLKKRA